MTFKDKFSSWFLKNLIKPRMEKMDSPGFVVAKIGGKSQLRELVLPEKLFIEIENRIDEEYSDKGAEMLYSSGKEWGYRYAMISNFLQVENSPKTEFKGFMDLFVKYIESVYADNINYTLDIEEKQFEMEMNDYIICRENGKGYIFTTGVWAGFLGYLFCDQSVESFRSQCEGRGDNSCKVSFGPREDMSSVDFETEIPGQDYVLHKNYSKVNKVKELDNAENSMNDLLKKGFFEYTEEGIKYENWRFFAAEASLVYILEKNLDKLEGSQEIIFEAAFNVGKRLGENKSMSFITDYFSALGFGGVKPIKAGEKIRIVSYPWTKYADDVSFCTLRGLISGIVSGIKEEEIRYNQYETGVSSGDFTLIFEE